MTHAGETKAQRIERLKRELNPWEAYDEIVRFAREGWEAIPPEWLGTYFRWWGIYTQGDGVGAVGGRGGEGKATRHFMLRVRVPNGAIRAHQLRALADLAERHARGIADITVRQNFQLHWIGLEALPEVFQALWRSGLTSMGSCGDVTRNVTGCPLAGVDGEELVDASPLVLAATRMLNGAPEFYNLPRKYKVSIAGCRAWCSYPEINDVGVTALRHPATGEVGFTVRVGGGLSTDPRFGDGLGAFVRSHQVLPVVRAISEVFRDSDVLRQHREKARLKFLFLHHGWTAERFRAAVEARLGFALDDAPGETLPPDDVYRDHVGIHPQRQPDLCWAGLAVLRGRLTPAQMRAAADLADRHGSGELRATTMQNLLVLDVRRERVGALAREAEA
ncbi:MAG: nitrite reductase, partial [Candidatus Rokubacteria bacterium]|nr:nitrite reductase [Candidatus Rokubacteria bacterium]